MEDLTGKTLGRYQLGSLIGRGGMATVYKARDPGLDRTVAIKLLHPHLSADPAFVARFRREARAVAALRHPNIVQVHEFDSSDGDYFMVMEFIDGPTLATLLARCRRKGAWLSSDQVVGIFKPLCSAVDYANGEGMVHRDIKPSNIILTSKGEPVITDYGIARIAGATSYTMPGTVVGSAQYMSPEQAQGQPADGRSDIYSLGVCLFEALTGRVPFDGETTASVLAQHLTAPVPAARTFNPDLSAGVEAVLARALAKNPNARYQQAADLGSDLEAVLRPGRGVGGGENRAAALPVDQVPAWDVAAPPPSVTPVPSPTPAWTSPPPVGISKPIPAYTPTPAPPYDEAAFRRVGPAPKRRRNWPAIIVLCAVLVAGAGVGLAFLVRAGGGGSSTTSLAVTTAATTVPTTVPTTASSTVSRSSTSGSDTGSSSSTTLAAVVDLSAHATLSASSVRASEGSNTYDPSRLVDGDPATSWVEGVAGYGEGEWFKFTFVRAVTLTEVRIIPGLDKVKSGWDRWWSNGRVQSFRLDFSDGSSEQHVVADAREMQRVVLETPRTTTFVALTIVSVYPAQDVANKADDTCVGEFRTLGVE
jgi:tRNA A-37 threonylcarbamoyl transferase component Bud32